MYKTSSVRRHKAYVSALGITQLHLRSPFVAAWWSAAFPGLGHLLLAKYLRGYILFIWEVVVNTNAHINLAIFYSFTGRFGVAKEVLDERWLLLYVPTYMFAIWDSYRTAVDINHNYLLAAREDAKIEVLKISPIELNFLDKRSPWVSVVWSSLMPGTGQLYINRAIASVFILLWWIVIMYSSKILPGIHYTLVGEFERASLTMDPHWALDIPSIYFFSIYDAYMNTVELNKLFEWEQSKFLNQRYQYSQFPMPSNKNIRGENMYIISTFEQSIYLELAITAIQMKGIKKDNILAVPLDRRAEDRRLFDTIHHSDGLSLLDLPFIMGALFMLFGGIYGFVLSWGPIIWGIILSIVGICLGLIIKLAAVRKSTKRQTTNKASEVVLIVNCEEEQLDMVKDTLWEHSALGVRKLNLNRENQ